MFTFAQWRYSNSRDVDAVVQITTKASCRNLLQQIAVGHGQQSNVDMAWLAVTETINYALLKNPQQYWL